jgi:hypothetical protein
LLLLFFPLRFNIVFEKKKSMVDNKQRNTTLKKLARWTPSSSPSHSTSARAHAIPPLSNDAPFVNIHHEKLQQGALYIIKIKQVSLAMFEGKLKIMYIFGILLN